MPWIVLQHRDTCRATVRRSRQIDISILTISADILRARLKTMGAVYLHWVLYLLIANAGVTEHHFRMRHGSCTR